MADITEVVKLLAQMDRYKATHRLDFYKPYPKQKEFHNARGKGSDRPAAQKLLLGGNKIGKTYAGAMEAAIHLTGKYPEWWDGVRFYKPINMIVGENTNESCRDIAQAELFGDPMDEKSLGTGTIPIECVGKVTRKAGVPNAFDAVRVKYVTGGWSTVYLRAYEQGFKKFMGVKYHVNWLDEEPPQDIWSQILRATLAHKDSVAYITMTPEEGMTKVVSQFVNELADGQAIVTAGWDDAPHLTPEVKEQRLKAFPAHEREMRSKGVPLMGAGLVFETPESDIKVEPFEIPRHWPRINGIDFGWDHPFAAGSIAWDRENDCIYVTNVYRASKEIPIVQAQAILSWGDWIPVAWPHDGLNTEKGTGIQLKQQYIDAGLNMLPWKATNPPQAGQIEGEGGNSVEASIMDMVEREMTGRLKVFSNCGDYFSERRMYHRDTNGKLVKLQDDLLSAVRYAVMMVRHARTMSVRPRKVVTQRGATNWS